MMENDRPHGLEEIPVSVILSAEASIPSRDAINKLKKSLMQVGGRHYKGLAIEPVEYAYRNGLDFLQGNIVKYVTRFRDKNELEDLKKARHYIDLLIEFEYGEESNTGEDQYEGGEKAVTCETEAKN